MAYILRISSPSLMRWMNTPTKINRIILVDLEPDIYEGNGLHLDLNVVIKSYDLKCRGIGSYASYYVGCTSARISFEVLEGEIKNHTSDKKLTVHSEIAEKRTRKSDFKLMPEITVKTPETETKAKIVEVGFEANAETAFMTSYQGEERLLTAVKMDNFLQWEINMPRGQKVISDFFTGNLYFYVESAWKKLPGEGKITVEATNVRLFGPERRPISKAKSFLMEMALLKENFSMRNNTEIYCTFKFDKKD